MLIKKTARRALVAVVMLCATLGATATPAHAIGTLNVADATIAEGTGGSTTLSFVVSLSTPNPVPITVDYATSNGSAVAGSDYTAASGQLTIPTGATSAMIPVSITTDAFAEPNETLTLTLSNASGATSIGDGSATGTIANDDGLPPALSVNDPSTLETDTPTSVDFTVSLAGPAPQDITVSYATSPGTASGADFGAVSGTATIATGQLSTVVPVTIVGDDLDEIDETFALTLSNAANATIADSAGVATIVDDDAAPIVQANAPSVAETDGPTSMSFTVTLDAPSGRDVSVDYATSDDTATAGTDYTATSGTLVFAPADVSKTVTVPVTGDNLDEADDETLTLTLSNAVNASIIQATSIGTIVDDEPAPALSVADVTVTEGDAGTASASVTVSLSTPSGQTVRVHVATAGTGTATAGSDYQAAQTDLTFAPGMTTGVLQVPVIADLLDETNETVGVVLSAEVNAVIADGSATLTITDDDATPTLSLSDGSVAEGNAGNTSTSLTLTLSAPSGQDVSVLASTSNGTATGGQDFAAQNGTVIQIPAGATSAPLPVVIFGDVIDEADESFTVNLAGPTNATIADGSGTITILDDDAGPSISISDVTEFEGTTPPTPDTAFTFTISLSAPSEQTVTVAYTTVDSTAVAGLSEDYDALSGTATFTPAQTAVPITVNVNRDAHAEPSEAFLLQLSAPVNATLSVDTTGTGTILNDDGPPASVSIGDVTVAESAGTATLTVTLSKVLSQAVTVDLATSSGSATAPADYGATSTTVTIDAGQTSGTTGVTIADDVIDELDETFTVTLSNVRNATIADGSATVTITDNDAQPTVSVADVAVTEGDAGSSPAGFAVTLSGPSAQTITVQATASNITTTNADHGGLSTVVTFVPGDTAETATVQVTGDTNPEADETFAVTLTSPTNATIADGSAAGTIQDDDAAGTFTPLSPTRLLDTRSGIGRSGTAQVAAGQTVTLQVTGAGGVPATGVAAVVLNLTATSPAGTGFVSATPSGGSTTSNVNYTAGEDAANLVMVPVAPDGKVRLYTSQTTHLLADVFGWVASDTAPTPGSHFTDVQPARVLDTRTGMGVPGGSTAPITAGVTRVLDVTGVGNVPATGVTAVILNVTVTQPSASSFLSVTPTGGITTSNSNFAAGETVAGLVVVPVGPDGSVRYAIGAGSAHVIADVFGWFATPTTLTGSVFTPVEPARLLDTRQDPAGPLGPGEEGFLTIEGQGGVPADGVDAAVLNITVTQPTAASYLAITPNAEPGTSNLNFATGQTVANLAVVPINQTSGDVVIYNDTGNAHVIVDVFAWFTTPAT